MCFSRNLAVAKTDKIPALLELIVCENMLFLQTGCKHVHRMGLLACYIEADFFVLAGLYIIGISSNVIGNGE